MDLILKLTSKCNFACTYCSTSKIQIADITSPASQLESLLKAINPQRLIITGGDPLCISPDVYRELLQLGSWSISLTTNLKAFFYSPDTWIPIFSNSRVGVCTSFQYGDSRMWDSKTPYSEQMFKDVFHLFEDKVQSKKLSFISVISKENEDRALDHLLLAKSLQTKCKLNGMMPLGKSTEFYPMHKLVKIWLDAFDQGLSPYLEHETCLIEGGCNLNTNRLCRSTIRAAMLLEDGSLRVTSCEDDLIDFSIPSLPESRWGESPSKEPIAFNDCINKKLCPFCELFCFCNGCHQYRKLNKTVEEHCTEMQKLKPEILKHNWKTQ